MKKQQIKVDETVSIEDSIRKTAFKRTLQFKKTEIVKENQ